ncbi:MAG: hypothetical protein COB04_13675 [Gammaproteobacteria bacterium]|nr:MAG: hypothetical protein COB04_13675 [Gammaproteobacteria bacterium]
MKLLVDIGNTRIKFALWDSGVIGEMQALAHGGDVRTSLLAMAEDLPAGVDQIMVAAVAGKKVLADLEEALSLSASAEVLFAKTEREFQGLINSYEDPSRMGVDRWLAMIGALGRSESPVCVVDCGSAITIDVVSRDRIHKGGYIVSGLQLAERSLLSKTEDIIVKETVSLGDVSWGTSTEQAVQMGGMMMVTDFIRSCLGRVIEQEGGLSTLVLTGGDAESIGSHLGVEFIFAPLLVLEGLALSQGLYLGKV